MAYTTRKEKNMSKLIAYYSRAGENYFDGEYRRITVGNTEKAAKMLCELSGAKLFCIEQEVPYSDDYKTCIKNTDFSFLPIHVKVYLQQIFGGQNEALHKELFAAVLPFCPSTLLFFGKADRRRSVTNGVGGVVLPVRFSGGENFLPQL